MPFYYGAFLGQNGTPALAFLLLGLRALRTGGGWVPAGAVLFVLAAAFKPWLVLSLGILPLLRWWRALVACITAFAALAMLLPRLVLPAVLLDGYAAVTRALPDVSILAYNNVSLRSLIHRLSTEYWWQAIERWVPIPLSPGLLWLERGLLVAFGLAALLLLLRRRDDPDLVIVSGLALSLLPLGVCWNHYLVLAVPAVLLAVFGARRPAVRWCGGIALAYLLVVPTTKFPSLFHDGIELPSPETLEAAPALWALYYSAPLAFALLPAIALLVLGRDRARRPGRGGGR